MTSIQNELQRGWQIHQQKRYSDAEAIYREVIAMAPNDANAWCYLGIALHDQRHFEKAVECYRKALELRADFPIALNNLGNSLRYINCVDEADQCFQKAIDLKPDYLNAYKNRGTLHVWTGSLELGLKYYQAALKIKPDEAELHRNLGVIYLLQGRFEEGWQEYRWRWRTGDLHRAAVRAPVWDGSDLNGKNILLTVEQGLGDTLHFVRYSQILRQRGAKTVVYCQPPLMALLQNSSALGPIYPNSLPFDRPVDFQCSLIDVADLLQTNANTIPSMQAYVQPSANLIQYWANRFPKEPGKKRIGIAWQGNPDHQADLFRSIPLRSFEPLADVSGVELISLQGGYGVDQIGGWRGSKPLVSLGSEVDKSSGAFMDTAAIMKHLDLVITSDTSIAHLAGAIGVPTWIAIGYIPDWRWLLERDDSPWYPTVRLFRQSRLGDWQGVFQAIKSELERLS